MENEMSLLAHQFTELQHGHCWVGINFKEALAHIGAAQAAHKKEVSHNCIWQLANHIIYWRSITVNRLNGSSDHPPFSDFLLPDDTSDANWKQTLLDSVVQCLIVQCSVVRLRRGSACSGGFLNGGFTPLRSPAIQPKFCNWDSIASPARLTIRRTKLLQTRTFP
jgi:hypothetical protein